MKSEFIILMDPQLEVADVCSVTQIKSEGVMTYQHIYKIDGTCPDIFSIIVADIDSLLEYFFAPYTGKCFYNNTQVDLFFG